MKSNYTATVMATSLLSVLYCNSTLTHGLTCRNKLLTWSWINRLNWDLQLTDIIQDPNSATEVIKLQHITSP